MTIVSSYTTGNSLKYHINGTTESQDGMNEWSFRHRFCTIKAILGRRQPERLRWILLWIMPLAIPRWRDRPFETVCGTIDTSIQVVQNYKLILKHITILIGLCVYVFVQFHFDRYQVTEYNLSQAKRWRESVVVTIDDTILNDIRLYHCDNDTWKRNMMIC